MRMNKILRGENHKYTINGKPAIGVNELLDLFGMKKKIPEHFLKNAFHKGTCVHSVAELHLADTLDEENLDDALKPYLKGFEKFKKENPFEVFETEMLVGSEALGICGQLDCLANKKGQLIYDWTISKNVGDWKWIQVALYQYLYNITHNPLRVDDISIVSILPGNYQIQPKPSKWSPSQLAENIVYLYQWRKGRNLL